MPADATDVRFGSLADIRADMRDVRFTPESGHSSERVGCPLSASSGYKADCSYSVFHPVAESHDRRHTVADRYLSLVNLLHVHFRHTFTLHRDSRDRSFDLTKIIERQLNIDCSQVLVEVFDVACARDWHDPRLLCQ